jgi:hypothetical protein
MAQSPTQVKASLPVGTVHVQTKASGVVVHEKETEHTVAHNGLVSSLESGCEITVVGGRTINTGNFNSVKISVGLKVPAEKDNLDAAYDFATNWVSKKLNEAVGSVPENGN